MKSIILVIALFFQSLAFAQSQEIPKQQTLVFKGGAFTAEVQWQQGPIVGKESILTVQWKNTADNSAMEAPGNLKVVLWMPGMGHGSSPTKMFPIIDAQGQKQLGAYKVTNIYFIMGDLWDVNFTLTYADGSKEIQSFQVTLPMEGSGHHHD